MLDFVYVISFYKTNQLYMKNETWFFVIFNIYDSKIAVLASHISLVGLIA